MSSATTKETLPADPEPCGMIFNDGTLPNFSWEELKKGESLGRGCQGEVKKARAPGTDTVYAIKTMQFISNYPKDVLRTINQIMDKGGHKNVVKTHAAFYLKSEIHILMEYTDLKTLQSLMDLIDIIPEDKLRYVTKQVLLGLEFLHERQVIHRDVKPSNILLCSNGLVKISDFGISKTMTVTRPMGSTSCGTEAYMSPERVRNELYSTNADVWSLGIVTGECAVGFFPLLIESDLPPVSKTKGKTMSTAMSDLMNGFNLSTRLVDGSAKVDFPFLIEQSRKYFGNRGPSSISKELQDFVAKATNGSKETRPSSTELLSYPFIPTETPEEVQGKIKSWLNAIDVRGKLKAKKEAATKDPMAAINLLRNMGVKTISK